MFIELIIEFELRSPGPPGRTCNAKTGYFQGKTKIFNENKSSSELLLTAKYIAGGNEVYLAFLHLDQVFIEKCNVLNVNCE